MAIPDLPDEIYWLTNTVQALIKPGAFLCKDAKSVCAPGGTRWWGLPDLPADATWAPARPAKAHWNIMPWAWGQSPYDGESFWLQLNMEDIPAEVRKPEWPLVGVVWVFIDLAGSWTAIVRFDPRPAASIPWQATLNDRPQLAAQWDVADTAPWCTPGTLPEIENVPDMGKSYDEWAERHYIGRRAAEVQIGGWISPCQGEFDDRNKSVVCSMSRQPFGDSGNVSLHYTVGRGFYAMVETH